MRSAAARSDLTTWDGGGPLPPAVPPEIIVALVDEYLRHRTALQYVANGNISPALRFAQKVLAGGDPRQTLNEECGK